MQVGTLYYKRVGIEIEEVTVIDIKAVGKSFTIYFKVKGNNATRKHPLVNFNAYYTLSKISLLRELLLDLDKRILKVAVEINEKELQDILNKWKKNDTYYNKSTKL